MNGKGMSFSYFAKLVDRASLRFRLTALVILTVLTVLGTGIFVDYKREYSNHIDQLLAALEEQAHALKVARLRIPELEEFSKYIDDFCAQMNEHISPGHHILVLNEEGEVIIRARHHSGAEVEQALIAAQDSDATTISMDGHRLACVKLRNDDGTQFILAQYLDYMEGILKTQLISRITFTSLTSLALILILSIVIERWVIKPINNLSTTARKWADRNFSARAMPIGAADFQILAQEFNSMSEQLEKHEVNRTAELEQAQQIQADLMPISRPKVQGLNVVAEYRPAANVAGDLYDIFKLPNGKVVLVIIDVCGHGISAALLTGLVKMSMRYRLIEQEDLSVAIRRVNEDMMTCTPLGLFVTACVGIWDPLYMSWTYCAAGHPGGILLSRGKTTMLQSTAPLLGVMDEKNWPTAELRLAVGDRVFLYTDGVEVGVVGNEIEEIIIDEMISKSSNLDLIGQVNILLEGANRNNFKRLDDATVIGFETIDRP